MNQGKQQPYVQNKKLILYFDANQTIFLNDNVQGLGKDQVIDNLLAAYAWGQLEQKDEQSPVVWKIANNHFTVNPPQKDCINFQNYVQSLHKCLSGTEEPDAVKRRAYNTAAKQRCNEMYSNFTKMGGPGIKLKPEYDRLIQSITLPKTIHEEVQMLLIRQKGGAVSNPGEDESNVVQQKQEIQDHDDSSLLCLQTLADGKFNIVPAFWRMILNLKKAQREFSIVFRTFGGDLPEIISEFNMFCMGEHPCYNGRNNTPLARFDGSQGTKNYIVDKRHVGLFYRLSTNKTDTVLVTGSLDRVKKLDKPLEDIFEKELEEQSISIYRGATKISVGINELLQERCALAIRDDYQFWNQHDELSEFGKPLFIDPTDYYTQHIFFDDYICDNEDCIVDIREALEGNRLPIQQSINKYLVRVDMIEALKDPDYFVKNIETCEKARAEEIDRIEKGLPEDVVQAPQKSDYEQLLQSSDGDYLRKTILPVLYPALQIVDLERPDDPISLIALYCLKHKDQVKIPVMPTELPEQKQEEKDEQPEIKEAPKPGHSNTNSITSQPQPPGQPPANVDKPITTAIQGLIKQ